MRHVSFQLSFYLFIPNAFPECTGYSKNSRSQCSRTKLPPKQKKSFTSLFKRKKHDEDDHELWSIPLELNQVIFCKKT